MRVETVPAEAVYLVSERGVTVLSGPGIERLAPLLDGTRTLAQLTREVSADMAAAEVESMLDRMSDANLIDLRRTPGPEEVAAPDAAAAAFWALAGLNPDEAARAVGAAAVEIVAVGGADTAAAAAACAESGMACCPPGAPYAAVSLVLCEDYLDPRLEAVNEKHLASGRPWLLARPAGAEAWIGPMFQPGAGPCLACLTARLEGSRDEVHLLRRVLGVRAFPAVTRAALPATRTAAIGLAVLEVAKWLAGLRAQTQHAIYILDLLGLGGRHHAVHRRPQCACCGTPGMMAARGHGPPAMTRAGTGPPDGGLASAERMLADYGHLVDPVTGIVAELRRDERCPGFQRAFVSGRNRALAASTVAGLRAVSRHPNGGRGVTEQEAKAGALGEAIERYSGTRHGDEPTVRGSLRSLGPQAMHPNACLLFDQRQFDDRARWNAVAAPFHRVPEPFDEAAEIDWTPVWSLLTAERRLLPTAMLYFQPSAERGPSATPADSNGNAAGGSLEDAIVRGFLEVVERDAIALWWYNRTRQPGVCLRSSEDPWLASLPERYARLGREVWVLDTTSDLGIPVMAAISSRTGAATEDIVYGFGAHFDPRIALRRALTELGQLLPSAGGTRAGLRGYGIHDPHLVSWWTTATVANQPYLLPQPGHLGHAADCARRPGEHPDLDGIGAIARRAGLEILVLDQTRPDIGMPVVKVVVPGMRHFWPRFAPGRIFDVPVSLGRRPRPSGYAELNPVPVYV